MIFNTDNDRHKDFAPYMSEETDCRLSPSYNTDTGSVHLKADSFTKECHKPTLSPDDGHRTYITDHDIR